MSRQQRYLCGTPEKECQGALTSVSPKWKGSHKTHGTREDAMRCYRHHLINNLGYLAGDSTRELIAPDGRRLILSKPSHFGGLMRRGKENRFMPRRGSGEIW